MTRDVTVDQVHGKAEAFLSSLGKLSEKERAQIPTIPFAQDFNVLLSLAKEVAPEVSDRLWPSEIRFREPVGYALMPEARYVEIEAYVRQVISILSPRMNSGPGRVMG